MSVHVIFLIGWDESFEESLSVPYMIGAKSISMGLNILPNCLIYLFQGK